jgi:hypothetical protein
MVSSETNKPLGDFQDGEPFGNEAQHLGFTFGESADRIRLLLEGWTETGELVDKAAG